VIEESERLYKTLFNSISHEMRTPLSAIMGASESLLDKQVSGRAEIRNELADEIHEAAGRLNRLVENLLDMTRLESGLIQPKLDWCDLHDLITITVRNLGRELSEHMVTVDATAELPLMRIDFALMEQVMTNLLLNASLYSPPGTEIHIASSLEGSDCIIAVEDNGTGLPAGAEDRVFEKFYRLPGSRTGGTGLGLSIARGFVQAHHGTIVAERREGGGTRFIIRLPAETIPIQKQPIDQ
jgi:two-component system sensor histidine kinase KdpD